MAGNSDEVGAAESWADQMFDLLQQATEAAVLCLVRAEPPADVAEAEKRARTAGVMARTVKAVIALKASSQAGKFKRGPGTDEEEMSNQDREISDAELAGLKSEFFARLDRLVSGLESKGGVEGLDRGTGSRRAGEGAGLGLETVAEPEPEPDMAA